MDWSKNDLHAARTVRQAIVASQQSVSLRRLRGLGASPFDTMNADGTKSTDDGTGNVIVSNPDGTPAAYQFALNQQVGWMQPPVYIAAGVGLLAGFLLMLKLGGK